MPASQSSSIGLSPVRIHPGRYIVATCGQRAMKVWGSDGEFLGTIRRLLIEKSTGHTSCVLVTRGRFSRRAFLLPWPLLRHDERLRAYLADTTLPLTDAGPEWMRCGGSALEMIVWRTYTYYGLRTST